MVSLFCVDSTEGLSKIAKRTLALGYGVEGPISMRHGGQPQGPPHHSTPPLPLRDSPSHGKKLPLRDSPSHGKKLPLRAPSLPLRDSPGHGKKPTPVRVAVLALRERARNHSTGSCGSLIRIRIKLPSSQKISQ